MLWARPRPKKARSFIRVLVCDASFLASQFKRASRRIPVFIGPAGALFTTKTRPVLFRDYFEAFLLVPCPAPVRDNVLSFACASKTSRSKVLIDHRSPCAVRARTSIASYRAEATFFKTLAGCRALRDIAPRAFWVHVNDRLGCGPSATPPLFQLPLLPPPPSEGAPGATENGGMMFGESKKVAAADAIEPSALRESSFIIVMGG